MERRSADVNLDQTLSAAAAGDAGAWRTLVGAYADRVYGLVLRQARDGELAEEITQAAFVKVVEHLGRYQEKGRFEPWLFRIAMNLLRDEMRRRGRQARTLDMSPGGVGSDAGEAGTTGAGSAGESARPIGLWQGGAKEAVLDARMSVPGNPAENAALAEELDRVNRAIARMSDSDREILHLRHTAGLSFAEIATTLKQPLGTVLARGHRALAKLRKALGVTGDENP